MSAPRAIAESRCGLPIEISACLFDLDGVLADTVQIHRNAWAAMFNSFLLERAQMTSGAFTPFDEWRDYDAHIDGKLRYDGVRDFLASRGIELPEGRPSDDPTEKTVCGLGNRKERAVIATLRANGVTAFPGSARYLRAVQDAGYRRAVVSASTNCRAILRRAGLEGLLEVRVDGRSARELGLRGKPAPDTYLEAARRLAVPPSHAAVFEDAVAGVESAVSGGFGFVVGIDRGGTGRDLAQHGANVVVRDLSELLESTC